MALLARARAQTAERTAGVLGAACSTSPSRRAQAGEISSLRVRIATGELAQARQAKLNADLEYRLACIHLSEMAGWPQAAAGGADRGARGAGAGARHDRADRQGCRPSTRRSRPARRRSSSARRAVKSADRDRLPEPQLGVLRRPRVGAGRDGLDSRIGLVMHDAAAVLEAQPGRARAEPGGAVGRGAGAGGDCATRWRSAPAGRSTRSTRRPSGCGPTRARWCRASRRT
jgi:hypothetical protein